MIGAPTLLPMLDHGRRLTGSDADRKAVARSESGTVVHEVGHLLAAAKLGVPVDFVMFSSASEQPRKHAVYMHDRHEGVAAGWGVCPHRPATTASARTLATA